MSQSDTEECRTCHIKVSVSCNHDAGTALHVEEAKLMHHTSEVTGALHNNPNPVSANKENAVEGTGGGEVDGRGEEGEGCQRRGNQTPFMHALRIAERHRGLRQTNGRRGKETLSEETATGRRLTSVG